jgi:hypothetical protein
MTAKLPEMRRDQRVKVALPVFLENATGVLRDMSASGAFFWTSGTYALGEEISFSIELQKAGGRMMWTCRGDVVRTEPRGRAMGVAVRIVEEELELAST